MVTVHYRRWCPPASQLRIEFRPELLDDVRRGSVRPSLFRPEINQSSGLLFGVRQLDEVRILSHRDDEHDAPLGIFVCRTRGEVFLTDDDLAILKSIKLCWRLWWPVAGPASSCGKRTEAFRRFAVTKSFPSLL